MSNRKVSRRQFLVISATGAAGIVLAACAGAATTAPTSAPAATAVPAATKAPAAAANTPTAIPTQAATATAVPTTVTSQYKEAPALAELVKAGKLPPVDQRLPTNPLTLSPIDSLGKYGGRLRGYYSYEGYWEESQYGHSPLRWIDDGLGIAPGIVDKWSTNADNSVWTIHIRQGLKWSDGVACTVDDVLFWWNDLSQATDPANIDSVPDFGQDANGKLITLKKVDDFTLTMTYGTPAPLTAKRLAMWVNGNIGPRWIAPMHYLKQFLPKYNTAVKDMKSLQTNILFRNNPDCPSLDHWLCTQYVAGTSRKADRNPYYYAVDTAGNQLPYIDGSDEVHVSDPQVALLQIRQGSIDFQNFCDLATADISTLKDGQDAGGYDVYLWDSGSGTEQMYFWNYDFPDKAKRDLYRTPAFKQGMSFALDRATMQKAIYYGTGYITTGTMSPKAFEFNFNADAQAYFKKATDAYSAYDPAKAATLLDQAGCKKGADGKRTMPDGSKLELRIDLPGDASKECTDILDIARKNWEAVGLTIVVNTITPTAMDALWHSGKGDIHTNWGVGDGPDHLLYPSWMVPNEPDRWAPLSGRLLQFAGTPTEKLEADKAPWDRQPPRFNKNDKEYIGSGVEKIHAIYAKAILEPDEVKRAQMVWQMWDIHINEGPMFIGLVANPPKPIIVSRKLTNIPKREQLKLGGFWGPWIIPCPAVYNPETWSFL